MSALAPFFFLASAELSVTEAVAVVGCLAVASLVGIVWAVRRMAGHDAEAVSRWPVTGSTCVDPD